MKWFDNMKIVTKILSGFILVALIAGGIGLLCITNVDKVATLNTELYQKTTVPLGDLASITDYYQRMRGNVQDLLMYSTTTEVNNYENLININNAEYNKALESFGKTIGSEESVKVNALQASKATLDTIVTRVIKLKKENKQAEAVVMWQGEAQKAIGEIEGALNELVAAKIEYAKETAAENTATANSSMKLILIIIFIVIALSVLIGYIIANSISQPVKKIIKEVNKMALGDIQIDFNLNTDNEMVSTNNEIGSLVKAFSDIVQRMKELANEAGILATAAVEGKLATRGDTGKFNGVYKEIVEGVNKTLDAVIGPLNVAADYVDRISHGTIPPKITDHYNGDFNTIKDNLNTCIDAVNFLVADANMLATAAVEGKLATRADAAKHDGDFRKIVEGVNNTLDAVIGPLNVAADYVDKISHGTIPPKITDHYNGDFNTIKDNLNTCIDAVNFLVADANMLATAAVEGRLATRADAAKHDGDFRKIVEGVNKTLDAVIGPVNEAASALAELSKGNLTVSVKGDYKGDHTIIKSALNTTVDNLNKVIGEINSAAEQVASGSKQVSNSSIALSQGATEQASSIEQLSASIEEITNQTKKNAENANQANELAEKAKENAAQGNNQMKEMLQAMDEINVSSSNISKIIKVIDEIAFQTNILALNAAVEAARAGQYGKGFAVVAEEVRNLAARSANAAKETTDMIEGSIKKVEGGTQIANETADALNIIVEAATKVAFLVNDIAIASNEQISSISQINQGVMQVSEVVQTNSATSEESAAASEELSTQAELMKEQVHRFKLRNHANYEEVNGVNPEVLKMLEGKEEQKRLNNLYSAEKEAVPTKNKVTLNKDFGKYN